MRSVASEEECQEGNLYLAYYRCNGYGSIVSIFKVIGDDFEIINYMDNFMIFLQKNS